MAEQIANTGLHGHKRIKRMNRTKSLSDAMFYIACAQITTTDDVVYGMKLLACEIFNITLKKLNEEIQKVKN